MSFYPMPNDYECGPFSLKYALTTYGIFKNEKEISKLAGTTWWFGTDEIGLTKAANKYHFSLEAFTEKKPSKAIAKLIRQLKKHPCILCVHNWNHWITVVGYENSKFIALDSGNKKVFKIFDENELLNIWYYYDNDVKERYDGYILKPKLKTHIRAHFTCEHINILLKKHNFKISQKWDQYLSDLLELCKGTNLRDSILFRDFLLTYSEIIIKTVCYWHGEMHNNELKSVTRGMRLIADVYALKVKKKDINKAIIALTALLTMYSCGKYGMVEIY